MPQTPIPAELQSQLARVIAQCVPSLAAESLVAIVAGKMPVVRQIGSGTLLAVADKTFVVTAGHVIRAAQSIGATVGLSGSASGRFVAAAGQWLLSGASGDHVGGDYHDVALYPLSPSQAEQLGLTRPIRIADVSFAHDLASTYFVVLGFPGMWSTTSNDDAEIVELKLLQYGTGAYAGSKSALDGYSEASHILLDAQHHELFDQNGDVVSFRTRQGLPADIPGDLGGISGGSVWAIADMRATVQTWSKANPRLVGVETGVYRNSRAIKVTRWSAIASLLYEAFPDLRPVLTMYLRA